MKDGVVLINCARGGLYNEDALYENLKSGKIAMAGIDVFKRACNKSSFIRFTKYNCNCSLRCKYKRISKEISIQAANNAIESVRGIAYPNALNLPIDESKILHL